MVTSALFAGFAAGLLAALLHFVLVQKLILLGEEYETGALMHFQGVVTPAKTHDHPTHGAAAVEATPAPEADGHSHEHAAAEDASASSRNALTSLFFGLTYVGYALILTAGYALAEVYGKSVGLREGLLWGIAGYAVFQLAPAMGLAPELPGTMGPELAARQIWWVGTVVCTASGLALLAYGRGIVAVVGGVLLLALPHVVGAPDLSSYSGVAPPELASAFSARSLGVGLIIWSVLGAFSGWLWSRQP